MEKNGQTAKNEPCYPLLETYHEGGGCGQSVPAENDRNIKKGHEAGAPVTRDLEGGEPS